MRPAALVVVALFFSVLASASTASAGTYQVGACDRAPADQNNSWQPFDEDSAHMLTGHVCPPLPGEGEQAKTTGLFATDELTGTGNAASGASAGWRFTAPANMTIVAVQADRYLGAYGDSGWVPSLAADGTRLESCTFSYPQNTCAVGGPFGNVNSLAGAIPVNNASTLTASITCAGSEGCVPGATIHHVWAALYGASVTLNETTNPSLLGLSGELWGPGPADGFHRGVESVTFAAADPSGISQATLSVDGHSSATQTGVCDYTYPIPCQGLERTLTLDTTQLTDGPHTLTLAVLSAAQNETQLTHQITVDNGAPATPSALSAVRALDGSDTVTWSDPPHVAPIIQVNYQLCRLAGGACRAPLSAPNLERLNGIHPPPGRWQIKVWLTDQIGNINPANAAAASLPASLVLHLHHRLQGRQLTVWVLVPSGVAGKVSIGYRAHRGTHTLTHGHREANVRRHRAQIVVRLPENVIRASRLDLTARADYALPTWLDVALPHHTRK
jgi:hypothetical protein